MEKFNVPAEFIGRIPARAIQKLERWVNDGCELSGFWYELLSGDYTGAACNADPENLAAFGWICRLLEQSVPGDAFGSVEAVQNWEGLARSELKRLGKIGDVVLSPGDEDGYIRSP